MLFSTVHNFSPSQAERSKPNRETSSLSSYTSLIGLTEIHHPSLPWPLNEPFTVKKVLFAAYWAHKVRVFVYQYNGIFGDTESHFTVAVLEETFCPIDISCSLFIISKLVEVADDQAKAKYF